LAAGGAKPLEQLSPADARALPASAQAGASLQSLKVDIAKRAISAAGRDIKLTSGSLDKFDGSTIGV
jgi:acetyl esterase